MIQEELISLALPYPDREDRLVRVFVPAHDEGELLPGIYMTDGQNLFDKESSGYGCWFTREAVRLEHNSCGRSAVIVGIHNEDLNRTNDLTPASIGPVSIAEASQQIRPQGEVFDDFIIHTVMPTVESRFPVKTGRMYTAVCGSSSGGLQAFFTAMSHPEIFGAAGVFSPAFLLYDQVDLNRWIVEKLREEKPFLYFYSGAGDDLENNISKSTVRTYSALKEIYPASFLRLVLLPEMPHHEVAWEPVFRDFLHLFLQL